MSVDSMDATAFAGLKELLKDAESCARLTDWEKTFLDGLREKVLLYKDRASVTAPMWTILERIEGKVYAT